LATILFETRDSHSVVDFSSAISELSIISKGSTLCHVIVEADCVGRQHLMVDMAPLVLANQEWLLSSTRRSYLHVLEARYAASRAEQLGTCSVLIALYYVIVLF